MKLIKSSYEILDQAPGLEGIYQQIEIAGRTCYKSQRPEGQTAKDFADRMIASKHYAMLEHGTVYLKIPIDDMSCKGAYIYKSSKYCEVRFRKPYVYVSTNMRVIVEHNLLDDLKYLCEPTEFHEKRVTILFHTDIGVSREANRHRVNSIAEQSTRYCNYSNDKFNNQLSIILPNDIDSESAEFYINDIGFYELADRANRDEISEVAEAWAFANMACEYSYMKLIKLGWKPQQARRVLPLDLNTELVHTAFVSDWEHFFKLRTSIIAETGIPHPDMAALCDPLYKEFIERGYIQKS